MIGKVISAKSFAGTVGYVMKEDSQILDSEGIEPPEVKDMVRDFQDQTLLNPRLKNTVGHISLSFSEQNKDMLSDEKMAEIAKEYMQKMGIVNTQSLIVRHNDTAHPHCHIVYNRVDNNGKTISDSNIKLRNMKACDELTTKHNLYRPQQKENVNREKLREPDKTKYEIYDAVGKHLKGAKGWPDFISKLDREGISLRFKEKGNTGIKEGILFSKNGYTFSGSKVDKQFSFSKLDRILNPQRQVPNVKQTSKPKVEISQRQTPQYSPASTKRLNNAIGNYKTAFSSFSSAGGKSGNDSLNLSLFGGGNLPIPAISLGFGLSPEMMKRRIGESPEEHIARITALVNSISEAMLTHIEEQKRKQKESASKKKSNNFKMT